MKTNFLGLLFILSFIPVITFSANPEVEISKIKKQKIESSIFDKLSTSEILNFSIHEIEEKLHRRLSVKERISLKFVKRKLIKDNKLSPREAFSEVKFDGFAIAGFILGLIGVGLIRACTFCWILFLIFGLTAIIFSSIALVRIKKSNEKREVEKLLAVVGLILGIMSTLWIPFVLAIMIFAY